MPNINDKSFNPLATYSNNSITNRYETFKEHKSILKG